MPNITKKFLENYPRPVAGKQEILRDDLLTGFGVRMTSGAASYVIEKRVNGATRRVTLCSVEEMTPEQARKKAFKLLQEKTSAAASVPTLRELLETYLQTRELRPTSVKHYRSVLNRCVGDWLDLPVDKITPSMVLQRHKELARPTRQGTDGRAQANKAMEVLRVLLNFAAVNLEETGEFVLPPNPVTALNRHRSWNNRKMRQRILPDATLPLWYTEVMKLRQETVRDYLVLLLLTGLRKTECAKLLWQGNIDFANRVITVKAEDTKNGREHQLPMSDFILELLKRRYESQPRNCQYVFPGRGGHGHLVDCSHVFMQIPHRIGYAFVLHDLRRTFLSLGERLGLSHFMLRKLANHCYLSDQTSRYIIVDVEVLREPMQRITDEFLRLMGATS